MAPKKIKTVIVEKGDYKIYLKKASDIKNVVSSFKRIIAKKNLVAYENREFKRTDATDIVKLVERLFKWTVTNLSS